MTFHCITLHVQRCQTVQLLSIRCTSVFRNLDTTTLDSSFAGHHIADSPNTWMVCILLICIQCSFAYNTAEQCSFRRSVRRSLRIGSPPTPPPVCDLLSPGFPLDPMSLVPTAAHTKINKALADGGCVYHMYANWSATVQPMPHRAKHRM